MMKTKHSRHQVLSVMISLTLILLPFSLSGQGTKPDFAGSWSYSKELSDAGQPQGNRPGGPGRGGFGGGDITVKQESNLLAVERTTSTPDGTTNTVTSKYTLDGKESVNTSRMGDSKSVATWSADGKKLTIKTTRTINRGGESRTVTSTEVWGLTDAKTLTIEMTMPSPQGERKMTSVYTKK
jgi:hypothetical protein